MRDGVFTGLMKVDRASEHPISVRMDKGEIYGDYDRKLWLNCSSYMNDVRRNKVDIYPGLFATDGEHIAHFLDSGAPSITIKDNGDFTAIYYGSKHINAKTVREFARNAGVHIYSDCDDVLYANASYITLHAATSGKKTLRLPRVATLLDAYTHEVLAENTDTYELDLLKGETVMIEIV